MESGDGFFLEYSPDGGGSWNEVKWYAYGDYVNGDVMEESIDFTLSSSEANIRFRSVAGSKDFVYVDEVSIKGQV